jgi:hypothetical protein
MVDEMSDNDNMIKTKLQLKIASEIYAHAYGLATELVDRCMPYDKMIKMVVLRDKKIELMINRQEALSAVTANILSIAEDVRIIMFCTCVMEEYPT